MINVVVDVISFYFMFVLFLKKFGILVENFEINRVERVKFKSLILLSMIASVCYEARH